jgi:hypothetical protein
MWPKTLRTKLAQGGHSGLSTLGSHGSRDSQAGDWTALTVITEGETWK